MKLSRFSIYSFFSIFLVLVTSTAQSAIHKVRPGDSIQAALDAASSGDTILVEPGTYMENAGGIYGLRISKDNIRLIGKARPWWGENGKVRIVPADQGQTDGGTGVYAAPPGCEFNDSACAAPDLKNFYIRGFTVEGFGKNGIQTRFVDGFKFVRNESINNLNNGIYPTLSANGLVRNNTSYGSLDTAMWVAGSENVRVIGNELFGSVIGFEITVSNNVEVRLNKIYDNTVGVGLFHPNGAGNPPLAVMEDWIIEGNTIYNNNRPNDAPPQSFQAALPPGNGVLLLGVSDHVVRYNYVEGHDLVGIGVLGWCTATFGTPNGCEVPGKLPITDPSSNNNLVSMNLLIDNGENPPGIPQLDILAADLTYFSLPDFAPFGENSSGNCFENNVPWYGDQLTSVSSQPDGQLPTDGC